MIVVRHGNLGGFSKFAQFLRRIAADDAAAAIEHRTFGLFDQADNFIQHQIVRAACRDCSRAS